MALDETQFLPRTIPIFKRPCARTNGLKCLTRTAAFHAGSQTKILLPGTCFHMFSRNLALPTPASPTSEAEIEGDALTKQRENTTRNTSPSPAGRHQLIMQHSQLKTMNESGKVQPNQSATNINSETFNGSTSQEKNAASLLHKKSITSTTPFSVSLSPKASSSKQPQSKSAQAGSFCGQAGCEKKKKPQSTTWILPNGSSLSLSIFASCSRLLNSLGCN